MGKGNGKGKGKGKGKGLMGPVGLYCELCGGYFLCADPTGYVFCSKYCFKKFVLLQSQRRFSKHVFSQDNGRILGDQVG